MTEDLQPTALRCLHSFIPVAFPPGSCTACPFSRMFPVTGGRVICTLLGNRPVDPAHPACFAGDWHARARKELDSVEALAAELAELRAVAHDAREDSIMYLRGKAEGAAAERDACCKAACPHCAAGLPARWDNYHLMWFHELPQAQAWHGSNACKADGIRKRDVATTAPDPVQ